MKKTSLLVTSMLTALCVAGSPIHTQAAGNCIPFSGPIQIQLGGNSCPSSSSCDDLYSMLEEYVAKCYPNIQIHRSDSRCQENTPGTQGKAECNPLKPSEQTDQGAPATPKCTDRSAPATPDSKDCAPTVQPDCKDCDAPDSSDCTDCDTPDPSDCRDCDIPTPSVPGSQTGNTSKPAQPAENHNPSATTAPTTLSYEEQVVALVNAERAKEGLPALKSDSTLQAAALARAKETVKAFSHTRPNGTSCFSILQEYGISYRYAGENIAYGQRTPEEVVTAWMNSEGHRANIMSRNFTKIGIGYYQSANGTKYWSQLFIS